MDLKYYLNKAKIFLNQAMPVGGLHITDTYIRYARISGEIKAITLRLEPGIISDGEIKNEAAFISALNNLRAQISVRDLVESVVVSIRSSLFYAQVFSLPPLPRDKIGDAVRLNLSMISPLKDGERYDDGEMIGYGPSGEMEYLGAFVPRYFIDAYMRAFKSARFAPIAIEFPGLSVARSIRKFTSYDVNKPAIVVDINASGIDFFVIKNGFLIFEYLGNLSTLVSEGGREIGYDTFLKFLLREISRISNFYSSKWGGSLTDILLISDNFPAEAREAVKNYGYNINEISLSSFKELGAAWLAPLGSAERGLISRSEDSLISLAPVGTEEEFSKNRLLHFSRFWRDAIAVSFAFILVVFISADSYLAHKNSLLGNDLRFGIAPELIEEVSDLESQAREFNRVASLAAETRLKAKNFSPILSELKRIAGSKIILRRISAAEGGGILVTGRSTSELGAITFKNALLQSPFFKDVNLPLANIVSESDGGVGFQMTLSIK